MENKTFTHELITAGQAQEAYPELKPYLADLNPSDPLALEFLTQKYAPGQPIDALGALVVMLSYLRRSS